MVSEEDKVIAIPKSFLDKEIKNSKDLIEFAVKMFYKHEPINARAFEKEMERYQDEPQVAETMQMLYRIPAMIFHFVRKFDPDFWHPNNIKNYKVFGEVLKKAKIRNGKVRVVV